VTCTQQLGVSFAVHAVCPQHLISPLFGLACHPAGQAYERHVSGASVVGAGVFGAQGPFSVVVTAEPSRQQVPRSV